MTPWPWRAHPVPGSWSLSTMSSQGEEPGGVGDSGWAQGKQRGAWEERKCSKERQGEDRGRVHQVVTKARWRWRQSSGVGS